MPEFEATEPPDSDPSYRPIQTPILQPKRRLTTSRIDCTGRRVSCTLPPPRCHRQNSYASLSAALWSPQTGTSSTPPVSQRGSAWGNTSKEGWGTRREVLFIFIVSCLQRREGRSYPLDVCEGERVVHVDSANRSLSPPFPRLAKSTQTSHGEAALCTQTIGYNFV